MQLRTAETGDLQRLVQIRMDPQVIPHQYPTSPSKAGDLFMASIRDSDSKDANDPQLTVIQENEEVAGYIFHCHGEFEGTGVCAIGFSLAPEYWGKGVMSQALKSLIDESAASYDRTIFIADCFRSNQRCKSLLGRLNFARGSIGIGEQVLDMCKNRCLKWVLRYRLEIDRTQNQR